MDRRRFLGWAGFAALGGCLGGAGGGSRFEGPTEEDPAEVDLRYRSYTAEEADSIRRDAVDLPYEDVLANPGSHEGRAVGFEGFIAQVMEPDDHFVFRIAADGSMDRMLHASWVGESFPNGALVACWGEVLGVEVFREGMGREVREPAVALADVEQRDG